MGFALINKQERSWEKHKKMIIDGKTSVIKLRSVLLKSI